MIDVHTFDKQYTIKLKFDNISIENKNKLYKWLITFCKININYISPGLLLIIDDTRKINNLDTYTNVYADDILINILLVIMNKTVENKISIIKLINEQMDDMFNTGRCPQGRTTRLYQIYTGL
jgi:hypothetical protein